MLLETLFQFSTCEHAPPTDSLFMPLAALHHSVMPVIALKMHLQRCVHISDAANMRLDVLLPPETVSVQSTARLHKASFLISAVHICR